MLRPPRFDASCAATAAADACATIVSRVLGGSCARARPRASRRRARAYFASRICADLLKRPERGARTRARPSSSRRAQDVRRRYRRRGDDYRRNARKKIMAPRVARSTCAASAEAPAQRLRGGVRDAHTQSAERWARARCFCHVARLSDTHATPPPPRKLIHHGAAATTGNVERFESRSARARVLWEVAGARTQNKADGESDTRARGHFFLRVSS